jgi:hypothetical protein
LTGQLAISSALEFLLSLGGSGERLGMITATQEGEQLVGGPVASGGGVGRGRAGERAFLEARSACR